MHSIMFRRLLSFLDDPLVFFRQFCGFYRNPVELPLSSLRNPPDLSAAPDYLEVWLVQQKVIISRPECWTNFQGFQCFGESRLAIRWVTVGHVFSRTIFEKVCPNLIESRHEICCFSPTIITNPEFLLMIFYLQMAFQTSRTSWIVEFPRFFLDSLRSTSLEATQSRDSVSAVVSVPGLVKHEVS